MHLQDDPLPAPFLGHFDVLLSRFRSEVKNSLFSCCHWWLFDTLVTDEDTAKEVLSSVTIDIVDAARQSISQLGRYAGRQALPAQADVTCKR